MKRRLTKAEIEAQLAEKRKRIDDHLAVMKEQTGVAADSLKERAQEVGARLQEAGEKVQEAGEQALELAPFVVAGGVGLLLAGGLAARLFRRRRKPAMSAEDLAALSEAVAQKIARSGLPGPSGEVSPAPRGGGKDEVVRLLLAALAGVALKVALDQVPWGVLWETLQKRLAGEEVVMQDPLVLPATTGSRAPVRRKSSVPRPGKAVPAD